MLNEGLIPVPPVMLRQVMRYYRKQILWWARDQLRGKATEYPELARELKILTAEFVPEGLPKERYKSIKSDPLRAVKFKLNLSDMPDTYSKFTPVTDSYLAVLDWEPRNRSGGWHSRKHFLVVNPMSQDYMRRYPQRGSQDTLTFYFSSLEGTVEHELRHAVQTLLLEPTAPAQTAMHKGYDATNPSSPESMVPYFKSPIEFDPTIGSSALSFVRDVAMMKLYGKKVDLGKAIRQVTAMIPTKFHDTFRADPFFMVLRKRAPERYKIAVRKFIAEVDRLMTEDQRDLGLGTEPRRKAIGEAECRTPGANYAIHISDHEIEAIVTLPDEVTMDFTDEEGEEFDDRIHDALEATIADMLDETDPDAEEHWDEARKNDLTEAVDPMEADLAARLEHETNGMRLLEVLPSSTPLIHFTATLEAAQSIVENGFTSGTTNLDSLVNSSMWTKKGPGYNFAFIDGSSEAREFARSAQYGVRFRHSGVYVDHLWDHEKQVIFWGPSVQGPFEVWQRELTEAPIELHHTDYAGKTADDPSSFYPDERGILNSPKAVEKIKRMWRSSVADVIAYFVDVGLTPDRAVNIALYGPGLMKPNEKEDDVWELRRLHIEPTPGVITVVFTNNDGSDRVPITGWIIAHRLLHVLVNWGGASPYMGTIEARRVIHGIDADLNREIMAAFSDLANQYHRTGGVIPRTSAMPTVNYLLACALGTSRACRTFNLSRESEVVAEFFAEFMLRGTVTLNRLEARMPGLALDVAATPEEERVLREVNSTVAQLERALNREFARLIEAAKGNIFAL